MLSEKRASLFGAAKAFAAAPADDTGRALCMAASAYAEARLAAASGATAAASKLSNEPVVPFGRAKGKPLSAVAPKDLEWVLGAVERSISDPGKERFLEANQALRDALVAELSRRR